MNGSFIVNYDGINLTDFLTVNSLDRGIGLGKVADFRSRKNRKGVDRTSYTSEMTSFSMDFTLIKNLVNKRHVLSSILNVDDPKPLTFSDEPGLVYYAIPKNNISINEIHVLGRGTIIWEIPDGVSYSSAEHTYTNKKNTGGLSNYLTVNNPGTEPMELELEAEFTSDNGYLGVSSDLGSALFGEMTEIDGYDYQTSELLFNDHMTQNKGWALNSGKVPPVTSNPRQTGTVGYRTEKPGEGYVYPTNYGTVVSDWSGPSLTKTVPPDSEGKYGEFWSSTFRLDFNTVGSGTAGPAQVGHQSITFLDQNNQIIVAIVIEDNYGYAEKSDLAIYIRNKRVFDSRKTDKYYVTARPGEGNHFHIEKLKGEIRVKFAALGKDPMQMPFPPFEFSETGIHLRKVTWYAARYKGHDPINNNLLRAVNVTKHNVDKWKDIPNKFMAGDVLRYGKEERNIYCTVNGINELRLRDVGSKTIMVPPGESTVYLAYSDFAEIPKVTLRGRARYTI